MKKSAARIISAASSPYILAAAFPLWAIARQTADNAEFLRYGMPFLLFSTLVPFCFVLWKVRQGAASDLHVAVREQRAAPFAVATISSFVLIGIYGLLGAPKPLLAMAACLAASGLLFLIITRFWKISVHTAGYAGSVLLVSVLVDIRLAWLFLLLPAVLWARLQRERHDPLQGIAGALVVSAVTAVVLWLFGLV